MNSGLLPLTEKWIVENSWPFLVIGFVFMVILLFFDHGEAWEKFTSSKGNGRILPALKLIALWGLLPATILYSIGAQWGSDEQAKEIASLRGRFITLEQRQEFIRVLSDAPKGAVRVESIASNEEAANFATQIAAMLQDSGYTVTENLGSMMPFGPPPTGVLLRVKSAEDQPPWGGPLQKALAQINVTAQGCVGGESNLVVVFIGDKP